MFLIAKILKKKRTFIKKATALSRMDNAVA